MKAESTKLSSLLDENRIVLYSIAIAIFYLLCEVIIDSTIFHQGSFREQILPLNDTHEVFIRTFVVCLLILFGVVSQGIVNTRRRAEEELRESEQNVKNIFANAMDGLVTTTLEGNLITFNDAFLELTGYTRDELLNMKYQDLTPPEYHDMEAEKLRRLVETGEPQEYEKEYLRKDGTRIPLILKCSTICDIEGKPRLLMGVIKDITERKLAEERLAESEKRYRTFVETVPLGIEDIDIEGNIIFANAALHKMYEYSEGELIGKNILDFVATSAERKALSDYLKYLVKEEPPPTTYYGQNRTKKGDVIDVRVDWNYRRGPEGHLQGFTSAITDITKHKLAEEQIKASLSEKEELLREIHHRVKNNLQIISSLLDMSRMQTDNEEATRLLTEACGRVSTMALIHSQLYQSDRFDRIDMDRHLRETTNSLLQLYGHKKNITIDIKASGVYMPVSQAIPTALALNELISNALEHAYKDRQEGTLEISMQKAADDTVSIRVKDDGIGIPAGIDPYKSDSLGLKLVRNLVQRQLKGELRYEVSKGTEFIIEFKVSREDEKEV